MLDHSPSGLFGIVSTAKRWLDTLVSWFCISLISLMTILVTYQVIVRYVFNDPSAVSEVLSRYLFIWLVLFGSAYVFGMKEHMAILFIKEKFSQKAQIIVEAFTELAIVTFALSIMIFGGYSSATRQMWQLDSALQIPMGTIYAAIPISGALMVFYFIHNELQLVERWKQLRSSAE